MRQVSVPDLSEDTGAKQGPTVSGSGGVRLATWDLGGDGPPLLFLHATGFHGRCYLPVAAALREEFHCWALDQRGHGRSDPAPDCDYSWSHFTRDALAVIDALGLDRPAVFGHSMGGAVALLAESEEAGTFAGMYLWEPVVIAPSHRRAATRNHNLAGMARRRRPRFSSVSDALANYAGKPPFSLFRADALLSYVEGGFAPASDGGVSLCCSPEAEARVYEAAVDAGVFNALATVETSVTLACGGRNPDIDATQLHVIAAALGGAAVEIHEGLGHLGPFEDPPRVAAAIAAALGAPARSA